MSTVKIGKNEYDPSTFSTPLQKAFAAYEKVGEQSADILRPMVAVGTSFAFDLKPGEDLAKQLTRVLDLGMEFDVHTLDDPPHLRCAYGDLPAFSATPWFDQRGNRTIAIDAKLTDLATKAKDPDAQKLMAAAVQYFSELEMFWRAWELRCIAVWESVQEVEWIAADLYYKYLARNEQIAIDERARYLYKKSYSTPDTAKSSSDDFKSLTRSLARANLARKTSQVNEVKREQLVVDAVTATLSVLTLVAAAERGSFVPDQTTTMQLAQWSGMASEAAQHKVEAMTRYMAVLAAEAEKHPIINLLSPQEVTYENYLATNRLGAAIDAACADALDAIHKLMHDGARSLVIPETRTDKVFVPSGLSTLIADSSVVSVWKLPFFTENAMATMKPRQANDVAAVMRTAAEDNSAVAHALGFAGVDMAMTFAPAAGPIGVGLALAWGIFNLGKSIHEYEQLSALFSASLDPHLLLRNLDHEPASKVGVVLDLIGALTI